MKFYKILLSSVFMLSLFSCKKVIDVKETDSLAGETALKTVQNNEQALIGAYSGINYEMDILLNAVMSDELKKSEFYNAATVHEWQFSTQDITIRDQFTAFPMYYTVIDRVNRMLQALPNAQVTSASDTALRSKIKGEALFLRAFCHFELYRYYSGNYDPEGLGMAYMEEPSLEPKARIKAGPYFQKIIADMTTAKNLVGTSYSGTAVYRANKMAVAGLQARVALYMRDWQNAIAYSTEYINALPLATRATFPGIWTDANTSEVAFKLARTVSLGGRVGSLFRGISTKSQATGDTLIGTVTWMPSDKLWNSYDQANDIRFSSYFVDEPLLAKAGRPSHLIKKYAGTGYTSANENVADVKVFRTGEMYLIRAEAKAESGDLPGAILDLNTLRAARINGYTNVTIGTKDQLISEVIQERFKELAYEGHRLWDLKRRNLPIERLASDAPTSTAVTLPAGNFRFTLPIPFSELQANSLIQQNPGYQ